MHHVLLGEGMCDIGDYKGLRFVWRRKSLGSIARKLKKYEERGDSSAEPMDLIGGTIIIPDGRDCPEIFALATKRAMNDDAFELTPSQSRDFAICLRGDDEYRTAMTNVLIVAGVNPANIQQNRDSRGMNLAKMTYMRDGIPTELQFLSEEVRKAMRIGRFSHAGYKRGEEVGDSGLESLAQISGRRKNISKAELWHRTESRAEKLMMKAIGRRAAFVAALAERAEH
jgi:hypothetical protein